ncbi:hypothetical protein IQ260_06560 [Leptolyngbya cf. ectocarpi LEGE 11479]|uniref:Uncharacterized protein n=1 Tax=Leptolyngbya cf. ectocarpi LEGE 11479 TaxID=1828722 RepID=A0A928ZT36_LEPEC|nr:hypothetical protein [Leptolyngbya ectocarpi]MBE9066311.1 hypothetical protein [Leptolyngbya cf. ectocarpi LEGE 11479]
MPPIFFVSFPFILLLLLSRGADATSTQPKSTKLSIEKVIDIIDNEDEIIIVRKKKH